MCECICGELQPSVAMQTDSEKGNRQVVALEVFAGCLDCGMWPQVQVHHLHEDDETVEGLPTRRDVPPDTANAMTLPLVTEAGLAQAVATMQERHHWQWYSAPNPENFITQHGLELISLAIAYSRPKDKP